MCHNIKSVHEKHRTLDYKENKYTYFIAIDKKVNCFIVHTLID